MKTSVLTMFLFVILGGVVYSAIIAGKSVKNESINVSSDFIVNTDVQPVQNFQAADQLYLDVAVN